MRPLLTLLGALLLAPVALAPAGCSYKPEYGDGEFTCGAGGVCPGDLFCHSDGKCWRDPEGGDTDGDVTSPADARPGTPDAMTANPADAAPFMCTLSPASPGITSSDPAFVQGTPPMRVINVAVPFDLGANPPLYLYLQLYEGYTVFTSGFTTGTFPLDAPEQDYYLCGICPFIAPALDDPNAALYFHGPIGGNVTINSFEGILDARLDNVSFAHSEFYMDGDGQQHTRSAMDGCQTDLGPTNINSPITPM